MYIVFESVLMLVTPKLIKISPWLSKLQLATVGAFFLRHSVVNSEKQESLETDTLSRQHYYFASMSRLVNNRT